MNQVNPPMWLQVFALLGGGISGIAAVIAIVLQLRDRPTSMSNTRVVRSQMLNRRRLMKVIIVGLVAVIIVCFYYGIPAFRANLYLKQGNTSYQNEDYDAAFFAYRKALAINPNFADAHFNLGNTFRQQHRLYQAISAYRRAIVLNPHHADAYYHLGFTLMRVGLRTEAINALNNFLQIAPYGSDISNEPIKPREPNDDQYYRIPGGLVAFKRHYAEAALMVLHDPNWNSTTKRTKRK